MNKIGKITATIAALSVLVAVGCYRDSFGEEKQAPLSITEDQPTTTQIDQAEVDKAQLLEYKLSVNEVRREKRIKMLKEREYWQVPLDRDLQDYIKKLCKQYGVSEQLAYAVITVETGGTFNPNLISETNDWGLFQINGVNHDTLKAKLGISNFLNPYENAKAGVYMLGDLESKYGSDNVVLVAYNQGEGGMQSLASRGIYSTGYSNKVLRTAPTIKRVGE